MRDRESNWCEAAQTCPVYSGVNHEDTKDTKTATKQSRNSSIWAPRPCSLQPRNDTWAGRPCYWKLPLCFAEFLSSFVAVFVAFVSSWLIHLEAIATSPASGRCPGRS